MSQQVPRHEDHETRLMNALVCPECGKRLELVALRMTREEQKRGKTPETVAICRPCEVGFSARDWQRRQKDGTP